MQFGGGYLPGRLLKVPIRNDGAGEGVQTIPAEFPHLLLLVLDGLCLWIYYLYEVAVSLLTKSPALVAESTSARQFVMFQVPSKHSA